MPLPVDTEAGDWLWDDEAGNWVPFVPSNARVTALPDPVPGVWISFGWDMGCTNATPFPTEVEALRHALTNHGEAVFVPWGVSVDDAEKHRRA